MCNWWWMVAVFLCSTQRFSLAQRCATGGRLVQYDPSPRPVPEPLDNNATDTGCMATACSETLVDGQLGAQDTYNSSGIHAWRRSQQRVSISFSFTLDFVVTHVSLFYYYLPALGGGLPNVKIYHTSESTENLLDYTISGNAVIGTGLNEAVLSSRATESAPNYVVLFEFENTNVNWLFLSEVTFCSSPPEDAYLQTEPPSVMPVPRVVLSADSVSPNLTFSCTVTGGGRFSWQWTGPGQIGEMILSNITRTSTVTFTHLAGRGTVDYVCNASYTPEIPDVGRSGSTVITVEFQDALELTGRAEFLVGENVTLECEQYGYFEQTVLPITWTFKDEEISPDSTYTITTRPGNNLVQNGGATPSPSEISQLTFLAVSVSLSGSYICRGRGLRSRDIQIVEEESTSTTTDTSSSDTSSSAGSDGSSDDSTDDGIVIIAVAVAASVLTVVIFLILIVIVVVVVLKYRSTSHDFGITSTHRKDSLDYTGEEAFYQEVAKPAPPPLPERFPDLNPDIEAYAVVSTTGNGPGMLNGGIEMRGGGGRALQHVPLVATTNMGNSGIDQSDRHAFLEKNPLYASSDNIDDEKQRAHQRRAGSIPSLDVLTDSPHGSQLNIYAHPSHLAPPIPKRPPTPELMEEPIYSTSEKNIHPSAFKPRMPSPPDEDLLPCVSIYADPQPLLRSEGPLDVTPENVREIKSLGVGQFGQVVLAEMVGITHKDLGLEVEEGDEEKDVVHVAVKRLKPSAEAHVKEAFEKEIKFMSRLRDDNVVRLLGICSTGNPFIIMEYMQNGDLNQFLHKHKLLTADITPSKRRLSPKQLTYICLQIASGMKYLAKFKFIHRDLATRNCLVGSNLKIKIADFGMSRSLYSSYYYRISGRAMLPIRWMANECFYGKFSEKTDVWAFGVTMWEVFMFAREQPYQGMTDQEVIDDAIKGPDRLLLAKPDCCPPEVYQVMKQCWIDDPDERARFRDAHSLLEAVHDFAEL